MDCISILAQVVERTSQTTEHPETIVPLDTIWQHITSMQGIEALLFISFGSICLFYGWRIFKILIIICYGLLGLAFGWTIAQKFTVGFSPLWGGIIGLLSFAVVAIPLTKWAVNILGAVAGGLITGAIWYAAGLSEQYLWAGALIGAVAGGMIGFIIFKISVMLFTSLGGSILIITGVLTLLYLWPTTQQNLEEIFFTKKWFLPLILTVCTAAGLVIQHKFVKGAAEWSV